MKQQLSFVAAAALACSLPVVQADIFKFWCGKKYNATLPSFDGYSMGSPLSSFDLPHGNKYHQVRVAPGQLPYESSTTDVTVVAYVPQNIFDAHGDMNVTISVPKLGASVMIAPSQAVNGVSFSGDATGFMVGNNKLSADVSFAHFENGTAYSDYFDTVFFDFWVVDAPAKKHGQSVVALNALDQSVTVNGGKPFLPIGYYVDQGYMFSGDYAAAEAAVKKYAGEGYNVLMHGGPIGSNATQMKWTLELCQKYHLYYQADVTDMTQNLTALGIFVSDYALKYSSFLSYYIGNEPDGSIGIGALEPSQGRYAHDFLKISDPYHPVTLVTNCAHSMPTFQDHGDFLMTDVYAVGIPTEYHGIQCNSTQGCCGCDLCDATSAVKSVFDRYDGIYADLGVLYPSMWFVEQTFYDNTSYWSRPPFYQEELAMAWASVMAGGSGVLGYTWPVTGVPTEYPQLGLALSDFASQMSTWAHKTVLSGFRVAYGSVGSVYYASWGSKAIFAVNTDYNNTMSFAAATKDLGLSTSSKVKVQPLGRNTNQQVTHLSVQGGLLVDSLKPLEIKVYHQ